MARYWKPDDHGYYQPRLPVIMGVAVLICGVVLVANLILDLIYAALDPRIKFK